MSEESNGARQAAESTDASGQAEDGASGSDFEISSLARIDLNLLVPLYVMIEERSVSRAAVRVGLSQPAMSHALNRCRRLLGDELLVRAGTRLQPTSRALGLVAPLRRLLGAINHDVLAKPLFTPAASHRQFQLSATSSTTLVLLPDLLRHFSEVAPDITIQVTTALNNGDAILDSPELELAILADRVPASLRREPLYEDNWGVAAAPDNPSTPEVMTLEELISVRHIAYEAGGGVVPPYEVLEAMGHNIKLSATTHDFATIPSLVARSANVAIVQARLARVYSARGVIKTWPLPFDAPSLSMGMIVNPRFEHDPATRWLRAEIRSLVERMPVPASL